MFIEKYELALRHKYENELGEELASLNKTVTCISSHKWEKQLEKCLTRNVFKHFQIEVSSLMDCNLIPPKDEDEALERGLVTYTVVEKT